MASQALRLQLGAVLVARRVACAPVDHVRVPAAKGRVGEQQLLLLVRGLGVGGSGIGSGSGSGDAEGRAVRIRRRLAVVAALERELPHGETAALGGAGLGRREAVRGAVRASQVHGALLVLARGAVEALVAGAPPARAVAGAHVAALRGAVGLPVGPGLVEPGRARGAGRHVAVPEPPVVADASELLRVPAAGPVPVALVETRAVVVAAAARNAKAEVQGDAEGARVAIGVLQVLESGRVAPRADARARIANVGAARDDTVRRVGPIQVHGGDRLLVGQGRVREDVRVAALATRFSISRSSSSLWRDR